MGVEIIQVVFAAADPATGITKTDSPPRGLRKMFLQVIAPKMFACTGKTITEGVPHAETALFLLLESVMVTVV